jgi:glycosyltransferase involved in cell wall biosynthesis
VYLTVSICTWNRAKMLGQTLACMRELRVPAGVTWELLVVNNNCTDGTDAVIERHQPHLPLVQLFEPKQGHSNARNCAVDHARGRFLIWTDDDVLVNPDWLSAYHSAFMSHPDAGYYGGPVDPWFEVSPPRWLARHWSRMQNVFAIRRYSGEDRPFVPGELPFGANLAFRTDLLRANRFDPNLGRLGNVLRGYDETDVIGRFSNAGYPGRWVSGAVVRHFIPATRMTRKYVWDWYKWDGRIEHQRRGDSDPVTPSLFGRPRWLVRKYLAARAKLAVGCLTRGESWRLAFTDAARIEGVLEWHAEAKKRADTEVHLPGDGPRVSTAKI